MAWEQPVWPEQWAPALARSTWAQVVALAGLVGVIGGFDTAYAVVPTVILGLVFCLVANGTDFWGLLSTRLSRAFGEITYSVYLLHGPLLFVAFRFLVRFEAAHEWDALMHWLFIAALTPVLLILASGSFRRSESLAMIHHQGQKFNYKKQH